LDYAKHLWMEREIRSVANVTRADVREMLDAAVEMGLTASVEELPLAEANAALADSVVAKAFVGRSSFGLGKGTSVTVSFRAEPAGGADPCFRVEGELLDQDAKDSSLRSE
jgi:hypothetical protein